MKYAHELQTVIDRAVQHLGEARDGRGSLGLSWSKGVPPVPSHSLLQIDFQLPAVRRQNLACSLNSGLRSSIETIRPLGYECEVELERRIFP